MSKNLGHEPGNARIVQGYETKNLNKSTFLLMNGAVYRGCRVEDGISTFILDEVNLRKVDEYWDEKLTVELWTFNRIRKFLKGKVKQKMFPNNPK